MFRKVLIANRGEIALRILRACHELGVEAVVAYSEADRESLAVQLADEAICIGPADATRSYLSAPAVISAALVTGCDAIHPGYGFLSEDEGFAEVVAAHDLTFIGPAGQRPGAVRQQGRDPPAAGRPRPAHHPGLRGMLRDDLHALSEAERIGYPVLIKPSAGGGGKGMRMVRTPRELETRCAVCRSEAKAAFGDDSLYLEKWLDENRHVEVQVAVDRFGHGIHLGERDCSVQRRHQKILEEGPTPALDRGGPGRPRRAGRRGRSSPPATRTSARSSSSSTATGRRLLHRDQLPDPGRASGDRDAHRHRPRGDSRCASPPASRSASPRPTSTTRGHAIEFRINAEDPEHDFRPGAGVVERYLAPGGPGVRMDSHLYTGYEVPPFYDSLLGKLIVWGPDRRDGHRPRPRRARRARHRRRRDQRGHPPGAARVRDVPRGPDDDQPARPRRQRRVPRRRPGATILT